MQNLINLLSHRKCPRLEADINDRFNDSQHRVREEAH